MLRSENIMHKITFIIATFILVISSLDGYTQDKVDKTELYKLQNQYKKDLKQIESEAAQKAAKLKEQYVKDLDSLMQKYTQESKLDEALAVREEKNNVMKDTNTKKISTDIEIVEGIGWKKFCVGATKEELIKALGKPDSITDDKWFQWKKKYIHCLIDSTQGAFELRFDAGFKGKTTAGIEIGSTLKQAIEAYGEPDSTEVKDNAKKLIWSPKGILIWFNHDKATQIVVFRPYVY
jgi:hypothetical protein